VVALNLALGPQQVTIRFPQPGRWRDWLDSTDEQIDESPRVASLDGSSGKVWVYRPATLPTYRLVHSVTPGQVTVGQRVRVRVALEPAAGADTFELPEGVTEVTCFLSADGLRIQGAEAAAILIDPQGGAPAPASFELQAALPDERTYSIELFVEAGEPGYTVSQRLPVVGSGKVVVSAPQAGETRPPILPALEVRVAPRPDVVLQVDGELLGGARAARRLTYRLTTRLTGRRLNDHQAGTVVLGAADLDRMRALLRETLQSAAGAQPSDAREQIAALGTYLYDRLFPAGEAAELRELLWQIEELWRDQPHPPTCLIVEDGLAWLPWELVAPYRPDDGRPRFLCERFQLGRWVDGLGPELHGEIPIGGIALVDYQAPRLDQEDLELLGWKQLLNAVPEAGITQVAKPELPIYGLHLLRYAEPSAELGIMPRGQARPATPADEVADARLNLRRKRPVVTLGILDDRAREGDDGDLLPERAQVFLRAGASAVIGPWWPTSPAADRIFWTTFYDLLIARNLPLGAAVWRARRAVERGLPGRLDWLAYTLFGDPRARPYWPEKSDGYATLECINPDQPLRPNKPYIFRACMRTRPPIWYRDRLIEVEVLPERMQVLFLARGLEDALPEEPIDMGQYGTMLQATVQLTLPAPGTYPLVAQMFQGDEHVKTLRLILDVPDEHSGGQGQ
jgi:hypothetical protein